MPISRAEKQRRRAAIDFARGSVRFEGVVLDDEIEALNRRFINGEISDAEHTRLLLEYVDAKHAAKSAAAA